MVQANADMNEIGGSRAHRRSPARSWQDSNLQMPYVPEARNGHHVVVRRVQDRFVRGNHRTRTCHLALFRGALRHLSLEPWTLPDNKVLSAHEDSNPELPYYK